MQIILVATTDPLCTHMYVAFRLRLARLSIDWLFYECILCDVCDILCYAMAAIFGMCNVGCKGIPHDHVVCLFDYVVAFFKTI